LHTFCLDDNYGWDDGLICGGRMTILADPLPADSAAGEPNFFRRYQDLVANGSGCVEAVVIDGKVGPLARYLFDASGQLTALRGAHDIPDAVLRNLSQLAKRPGPCVTNGVAYLPVLPRIRLLIVGGGHVGQAVAKLASDVDFDVWVLDDRERYASRERFPTAERLLVGDIGPALKQLLPEAVGPSTYCLIVTRGHSHDEEALYHLAPTNAGYVGMIGSKRKIKLIYEDLLARGISEEALARVHAPLGFDIGSQTVPEIAVSIVAELIACRNMGTTTLPPRSRVRPGTTASA
jgi:xanthine dehydrogenase accessory factor